MSDVCVAHALSWYTYHASFHESRRKSMQPFIIIIIIIILKELLLASNCIS